MMNAGSVASVLPRLLLTQQLHRSLLVLAGTQQPSSILYRIDQWDYQSSEMASRAYREKLIEEVKKYPILYDTRHESHRDIDARDQCWLKIATKLSINSELLKREWKILRDSMRQALKRAKSTTTRAGLPCKKWRFENKMAFLLPYMTVRRNQRHFKEDIKIDEIAEQSEQESEVWDPGNSADQDSLDLFFASVCQSTKRLPKKLQSQVKRQVLEVLLRTEEDLENELSETKAEMNKNF